MLYPLKFSPVLKDKIWGGTKLEKLFDKPSCSDNLGESWELSGYEKDESVVINGYLAGKNLNELIQIYKGELLGDKIIDKNGLIFPLLFKLIDANENLSIQVHPGDKMAKERHNSFGKTEMWYVIDAEPGAELIIGFENSCSSHKYLEAMEKNKVEDLLQKITVKKGDVFFIPAGLVHAIGKGVVVAEIQQSSDITYRIYDYKRTDDNGKERELHTELALDVINFSASKEPGINYNLKLNESTSLVQCEYFTTNLLSFNESMMRNYESLDSFVVYMCLEGSFIIEYKDVQTTVSKGDTVLIPAVIPELKLTPSNETTLLEVYIV